MTENKNMDIKDVAALLNSSETVIDEKEAILGYLRTKDGKIIVPFINPDNKTVIMNSDGTISVNPDIVNKSSGLEVGDIGLAFYVDETKGLRRKINGSIVTINDNTQGFLKFLKGVQTTTPDLFTDEATWQAEATMNVDGCVYKFVIDESAGTIRLPKYPEYIEITTDNIPVNGSGTPLVMTNGTGSYMFGGQNQQNLGGYFSMKKADTGTLGQTGLTTYATGLLGVTTDPTKSGIQTSGGLNKLKIQYFIQIATGVEESVDIKNEIELNNPFTLFEYKYTEQKLNNASWLLSGESFYPKSTYVTAYEALVVEQNSAIKEGTTQTLPSGKTYVKRGLSVKLSTASYADTDFVLNTANQTFRLPLKTAQEPLIAKEAPVVGNGKTLGWTNGSTVIGTVANKPNGEAAFKAPSFSTVALTTNLGIKAALSNDYVNTQTIGISTDPTNSGLVADLSGATAANLNLYFYVGETVQNANLIDVGRIQEQIAAIRGYLVESYVNGASGYRVYSDGYCEQWGQRATLSIDKTVTITLLKKFKNTYYNVSDMNISTVGGTANTSLILISKAVDSFVLGLDTGSSSGGLWRACGYIAEGEY